MTKYIYEPHFEEKLLGWRFRCLLGFHRWFLRTKRMELTVEEIRPGMVIPADKVCKYCGKVQGHD